MEKEKLQAALAKMIKECVEKQRRDSTWYHKIDGEYALVLGWDDNLGLCGKIAYNCDDLQCDYDVDWFLPQDKDGNVIDTEVSECETGDADALAAYFIKEWEYIKNNLESEENEDDD